MKLKISEIYNTISGEVGYFPQGTLVTVIRLQGCNLRCSYCDAKYAQNYDNPRTTLSVSKVVDRLVTMESSSHKLLITGGEPLYQREALDEFIRLLPSFYNVQIETNGTLLIPFYNYYAVPVFWVVDHKLPSTGMKINSDIEKYSLLRSGLDWIKFVCADYDDFEQAVQIIRQIHKERNFSSIAFSPVTPGLQPSKLYEWICGEGMQNDVILNVQLHKLIVMP